MEVGGAYAHLFFNLLTFLELRTLVITDLDAVNQNDDGKSCKVSEGTHTSNNCIKKWFGDPNVAPGFLIKKPAAERIIGSCRLAYEIPEADGKACGRSFEDAFILANPGLFSIAGPSEPERETQAWVQAEKVGKKSDFALEYGIQMTNWIVPRYVEEGLLWLTESSQVAVTPPAVAPAPALPVPVKKDEANA